MGRPFGYLIVRLIAVIAIVLSPCSYTYAETMYGDIETEGICCIMPGKASKASCVSKLPSETAAISLPVGISTREEHLSAAIVVSYAGHLHTRYCVFRE